MKIAINNLERALLSLDQEAAEEIIFELVKTAPASEIAGNLISETLRRIGESWEQGKLSLSQIYTSGIICEKIIDKILLPTDVSFHYQPKIAIGVFEDFHLLGKRIVHSTLRAAGFEVMDLGGGLTSDQIEEIVIKEKIEILLISVLMLPSALRLKELTTRLVPYNVQVVVGGAPFRFDENLWKEIGADYCGHDSSDALTIVNQLIEEYA
jgi:methanogenic corrinoid protein MtbC1